jgi:hypothetical protein
MNNLRNRYIAKDKLKIEKRINIFNTTVIILNFFIAAFIGYYSIKLQRVSVDIAASSDRLANQIANQQKKSEEIIEIGNMDRLYTKCHNMNNYIFFGFNLQLRYFNVSNVNITLRQLDSVKIMFMEEMNNPFMIKNSGLRNLWSVAYREIDIYEGEAKWELMCLGDAVSYVKNNKNYYKIRTIDTNSIEDEHLKCCQLMGGAFHSVMDSIKNKRIRMGLEDVAGKMITKDIP